jgi:DNA mismatch repair ATPase MutS
VNGRHPTVELGLLSAGRGFTPNTVSFAAGSSLHVITGPNMAGKSTLLRQTALIALLAQAGAFVPADAARVGIADALFARVGARDDVVRDRSTFMVEMLETAAILRGATRRSLVIVDEVGRGTTVRDGLALAFAALVHLLRVNGCRTLFATHFHELADMLGAAPDGCTVDAAFCGVQFFCTDVQETQVRGFLAAREHALTVVDNTGRLLLVLTSPAARYQPR